MSEHTPGPWKIDRRRSWSEVRDPEGCVLAEVGAINCDASTAKANARLITAAPDMLAALKALRDAVCDRQRKHDCPGFDCSVCTPSAELNAADAAIAKAESKS